MYALQIYIECSSCFGLSEQLFVCFGSSSKGLSLSKQTLSHWIVDAIAQSYTSQGKEFLSGLRAHSTEAWHPHGHGRAECLFKTLVITKYPHQIL